MKKTPLRGKKLLQTAVNQILEYPETWNQTEYHSECGTMHCIAGWCQILGGRPANRCSTSNDSQELLGISINEAFWLFSKDRSLREIYNFAKKFDLAGFDRDGFDRAGFDLNGFNRAGFNIAGFDRAGFDRDGFDRAGFDLNGFHRAGLALKPFLIPA